MFSDALTYPKDGTDAAKTILIGGVLTLLSVLVLPIAFLTGYLVRVVRAIDDGERAPPAFEEWGDLFVDGLKGMAIMFLYFLVPAVVFAVFVGSAGLLGFGRLSAVVALFGALVALPVWVAVWYVATAGFLNFAVTGRFGAAFEFGALRPILSSGTFATAWLVGLAILVLASIVGGIVAAIPILGLASAFVVFYGTVAAAYCYARGFADSVPVEPTSEAPAADPAA